MYQVYTHPKYIEHGREFVRGVTQRYTEYARSLSPKLGIPVELLTGFIFIFVRSAVHYALFEDEFYLKTEMNTLKLAVFSYLKSINN